jgi:hypothetical protein
MSLTSTPAAITFTPELAVQLRAPFDWRVIDVQPGSAGALWAKDGTAALALAYADPRLYEERLDEVVGPENWLVEFTPWGDHTLMCSLTIGGVTKCSTGEADPKDKNAATVAEAQAFKRACTTFGLGRYGPRRRPPPTPVSPGPGLGQREWRQPQLCVCQSRADHRRDAARVRTRASIGARINERTNSATR